MDCCCRPQQPAIQPKPYNMGASTQTPKLKYSFRTKQTTTVSKWTTGHTSTSFDAQMENFTKEEKYGLGSTVASNNELIELERQRENLLQQDRNLNMFYENSIVPLERQVQFYEQEIKIRSIEIMELQDLLNARMQERNIVSMPEPVFIQPPQQPFGNPVFLPLHTHFVQNQENPFQNLPIQHPVTVRPTPLIQN